MGPWGRENIPGAQGRARVPEEARGHGAHLLLGCISQLRGPAALLRKTRLQGKYNVGQPLPERTGDRVCDALQQGRRDPWAARTRLTGSALQRMVGSVSSDPPPPTAPISCPRTGLRCCFHQREREKEGLISNLRCNQALELGRRVWSLGEGKSRSSQRKWSFAESCPARRGPGPPERGDSTSHHGFWPHRGILPANSQ